MQKKETIQWLVFQNSFSILSKVSSLFGQVGGFSITIEDRIVTDDIVIGKDRFDGARFPGTMDSSACHFITLNGEQAAGRVGDQKCLFTHLSV